MYSDPAIWYFIIVTVLKQKLKHSVDIYGSIFKISVTQQWKKKIKWLQKTTKYRKLLFLSVWKFWNFLQKIWARYIPSSLIYLTPFWNTSRNVSCTLSTKTTKNSFIKSTPTSLTFLCSAPRIGRSYTYKAVWSV